MLSHPLPRRSLPALIAVGVALCALGMGACLLPPVHAQEATPKKILSLSRPAADNPTEDSFGRSPGHRLLVALMMLGGVSLLSVSLGPMLFSGARGRRIDSVLQAKKSLQLASLAELPTPEVGKEALASAYDRLFQELQDHQAIGEGKRRSFAITSALEEEGRSSITANLAMAAARQGYSVLVVDCDLRRPVQHLLFGDAEARPAPGLTDLLVGSAASPTDALRETPVPGVRLLSVGDLGVDSPADMFGSRAMERFVLNVAPRLADLVLYDAPHLLSNEPGRRILQYVDGVLYAIRLGSTDTTRAKRGLEKLAQAGARVVGGVFVPKGYFDLLESVPVPGRLAGVEKIVKNTETIAERGTETPETESSLDTVKTDEKPMSNATETAEKPATPAAEGGMDDLESVLQGWRRRDHTEAAAPTTFETRPNLPEGRSAKDDIREALKVEDTREEPKKPEEDASTSEATATPEVVEAEAADPLVIVTPIVPVVTEPEAPVVEAKVEEPKEEAKESKGKKTEKPEETKVEEASEANKIEEPAPMPVVEAVEVKEEAAAPVIPVPEPVAAPVVAVAPTVPVAPFAAPVAAPAAPVAVRDGFQELDVQIDMFPTAPGEMTMRAVTSNATAAGIPNVVLEMTTQMHAMRGMRAITPSQGDPEAPRIALETSTTDTPEAAKMRILVGEGADAAFEAVLKTGEAISVRTGGGTNQPAVRMEMNNDKNGGTVVRATVEGTKDRQEVILEMRREALTDSFSDAKWKNRVSIFASK
jgi:Mrp family chromosome partitioning ATPase